MKNSDQSNRDIHLFDIPESSSKKVEGNNERTQRVDLNTFSVKGNKE